MVGNQSLYGPSLVYILFKFREISVLKVFPGETGVVISNM